MKKLVSFKMAVLVISVLTCCMTFSACSDDDELDFVADVEFDTEQSDGAMLVEAWASEYTLEIKSDGAWVLETTDRFYDLSVKSGSGNATVLIEVEDNQGEERKVGCLTVVFPGHEDLNKEIFIEQKWAGDYDDNAADTIATSNKIYAVGYSYDATGQWAHPNSVQKQIFDTKTLIKEGILNVGPTQVSLVANTITGSSISDMTNALAVKANVNGGFGKFKAEANASFDMNHTQNSNYEYASTYFNLDVRYASLDVDFATLCYNYMTDDAWYAINGVPREDKKTGKKTIYYLSNKEGFKKLVESFGTHVILSAKLGGRVRHSMSIDISKITSSYDVKAFAKASYDGVFASGGGSVDEKFKQSYTANKDYRKIKLEVLGGDESIAKVLGQEGGEGFTKENLDAWVKSVTTSNMALVDFDNYSLVPLYELIDETLTMAEDGVDGKARKQALKDYMEGKDIASDFSSYDCGTVTEIDLKGDYFENLETSKTLIHDVVIDGQYVGQICSEYIPNINRDARVTVVYPVINNVPRYNMGFFIGNKSHRPARVSWDGTDVAIEEYPNLEPMSDAGSLYLRGASIASKRPEGTTHVRGSIQESGLKIADNFYPVVKIFNHVWISKDYRETLDNAGNGISNIKKRGDNLYYLGTTLRENKNIAPKGWRVATSTDYIEIQDKLSANGIADIARFFWDSSLLGYNVQFVGWYDGDNYKNGSSIQAEYHTVDGYHIRIRKDGGVGIEEWTTDALRHYWMSIRLVKE
ncbi:MAG: hypothetical protein IJD84_08660 [Parabacteroides sp.]|nr:hypothetical protein [Parabacteroides sp.]